MPSRTDALFRPAWNRPRLGTLWLPHLRLRVHPRETLLQRGQRAFRCKTRGPQRSDYPQPFATGCRRNSCTPSRLSVEIPSLLTSLVLVTVFRATLFLNRSAQVHKHSELLQQDRYRNVAVERNY